MQSAVSTDKTLKVLVLCTGNSCRSQMAEGFLRSFAGQREFDVVSAGTQPEKHVNPLAVRVMDEIGIDISRNQTKSVNDFLHQRFDWVITVCDNAYESCPYFAGEVKHRTHIAFKDPAKATGTEEKKLLVYREVRDQIRRKFLKFYEEILKKT